MDAVNPKLDPIPWMDNRRFSLRRGILPWGHAQFLPRDGYSQNVEDYREQQADYERAEDARVTWPKMEEKTNAA